MPQVFDAPIRQTGPAQGAVGSPVDMPRAPRIFGPVVLVAHALPMEIPPGTLPVDADVRGHPHIGLVAISYLLEGYVTHRDSLGTRHEITPGSLSWTYSGKGMVHSERLERLRVLGGRFEMLQILLALPDGHEDDEPAFASVAAADVPVRSANGAVVRTLAGAGTALPFPCQLVLEDVALDAGGRYACPDAAERALYVLSGAARIGGVRVGAQQTVALDAATTEVAAVEPTRLLAFGGDPVGPRFSWWNFIHSSLQRIEQAKARWRAGEFTLPPGDTESFTPAPPDDGRPLIRLNGAADAP